MTSMIDVVFLLLIFFMTTASFVKTEQHLHTTIENQDKSATRQLAKHDRAIIKIERNDAGVFVYKLGGNEFETVEGLAERLKTPGLFTREQKIEEGAFIHVDDEAIVDMAAGAIQACKDAGFQGVTYVPSSKK